jgi:hypothetical protein
MSMVGTHLLLLHVVVDRRSRQVADLTDVAIHGVVSERALGAGPHHVNLSSCKKNSILTMTPGNTKGGSITVLLTSCLTGLESAV